MPRRKKAEPGFYAVRRGFYPGIYTTWEECELQVKGFRGCEFKKFPIRDDAEQYINEPTSFRRNYSNEPPKLRNPRFFRRRFRDVDIAELKSSMLSPAAPKPDEVPDEILEVAETLTIQDYVVKKDGFVVCHVAAACFGQSNYGAGVYFGEGHKLNLSHKVDRRRAFDRAENIAIAFAITLARTSGVDKIEVRISPNHLLALTSIVRFFKTWVANGWKTPDGTFVQGCEELQLLELAMRGINTRFLGAAQNDGLFAKACTLALAGARKTHISGMDAPALAFSITPCREIPSSTIAPAVTPLETPPSVLMVNLLEESPRTAVSADDHDDDLVIPETDDEDESDVEVITLRSSSDEESAMEEDDPLAAILYELEEEANRDSREAEEEEDEIVPPTP